MIEEAVELQQQLQNLFCRTGFLLFKWKSSESAILLHIPLKLQDAQSILLILGLQQYTKTLGIEWNATLDHFCLAVTELPPLLGWFSPTIIKVKILL